MIGGNGLVRRVGFCLRVALGQWLHWGEMLPRNSHLCETNGSSDFKVGIRLSLPGAEW